jgi:ACS family glucarate transporter-like MFS transporter
MILVCLRFFLGTGEAVMYPASNQFVMRWIPEKERGFTNGLIFAGVGAGSGLTPPLLTWLIINHGWRSAFWFSAVVGLAAGAVWWVIARDSPEEHPWVSTQELTEIRSGSNLSAASPAPAVKTQPTRSPASEILWNLILRRRDLLSLMGAYFGFLYVVWIYFSWFFIYMVQVRGFDLKASARYSTLPFLSMTVGCLIGGKLTDVLTRRYGLRVGRCGLAAAASLLTALFLVIGSQVSSPELAGFILAGGAGALYLSQSSYWSAAIDIAGPSSGVFSSIINMGGQIGGAVTASLTPWIAQRFGWTTSFGTAAALAAVSAILWATVHPERPLGADALDSKHNPGLESQKIRSQEPAAI